jgi:hypothetical protein
MRSDWFQAVFLDALSFGTTKVRSKNDARAVLAGVVDGWERGTNARVIRNRSVFNGHIEINSDEDALIFKIEIFDGKFLHKTVLGPLFLVLGIT